MTKPLITVITAVHNGAALLPATVASIQAQTVSDWEYIIVDDASTDDTMNVALRLAQADGRISVLPRTVSGGPYAAANDGLWQAKGKFILRTDGDDLSPPLRFEKQLRFLEGNPNYRACLSYWQSWGSDGPIPGTVATMPVRPRVLRWYLALRGITAHSSACIETAALKELGGYKPLPLSQDYRLWCDLSRREWLGVVPEVLSYVRKHEGRVSNHRGPLQRQLALEALDDHISGLTGNRWLPADLEALWAAGHSEIMPVRRGLTMLDRWERAWSLDKQLTPDEQSELRAIGALRRWKHLRSNLKRQPQVAFLSAIQVALQYPRSLGSVPSALR